MSLMNNSSSDLLPTPTLVQQQQSDVWHLLCKGSPAYPGAVFSLYLGDHVLPVNVQKAKITEHQVVFPVPVQDTAVAVYQCEYSVLLGMEWSISGRSPPLLVSQGKHENLLKVGTEQIYFGQIRFVMSV